MKEDMLLIVIVVFFLICFYVIGRADSFIWGNKDKNRRETKKGREK